MKWRTTLAAMAFAAVALVPAALRAQDHGTMDFTGKWEVEFPAPWGIVVWEFDIDQDGENITGKSVQGMGTLMLAGSVDAHAIAFTVDLHDGPHALSMDFTGDITSTKVGGKVTVEDAEPSDWTMRRVET